MSNVFLSYDREDVDRARSIALTIEKAGHSVWWDRHIKGGAQYSKEIERALNQADAVVVLWSEHSVESAWVRDEAAAGRDNGRLIPVRIDFSQPPLGFRQFQTIDLKDWKRGARSRGYKELEQAIAECAPAQVPPERMEQPVSGRRVSPRMAAMVALPVFAAMAAAGYLLWPPATATVPTVTVVPASNTQLSQALSRDLLAKLGILQASNSAALQLVEQGGGKTPDLIFKIDAANDEGASKATLLLLSGGSRELLWSGDFNQPSGNLSDLKQQLAYSAANVLDCASEAYGPGGRSLDEITKRLYLTGCGAFTQVSYADLNDLIRNFREVVRRAPRFEDAWARLLNAEDELLFLPPFESDTPAAEATLKSDISAARKVNPDIAEAYIAEADLVTQQRPFVDSFSLVELAAERNPDNPGALGARAEGLMQIGRLNAAMMDARRAVQFRPFSPRAQELYISVLTYSGKFDAARQELSRAEALFPGASNFGDARFRLNLRYGSPQEALKQLRGRNQPLPGAELFLKARIDPSPANVAAALGAARKRLNGESINTADYVQTLAAFGRTEELINLLLTLPQKDLRGRFGGVLFRPTFYEFWRDPRSLRIAARFGLVQYWRHTGHWPDLCSWPDLPYDCKKEAARLHA